MIFSVGLVGFFLLKCRNQHRPKICPSVKEDELKLIISQSSLGSSRAVLKFGWISGLINVI